MCTSADSLSCVITATRACIHTRLLIRLRRRFPGWPFERGCSGRWCRGSFRLRRAFRRCLRLRRALRRCWRRCVPACLVTIHIYVIKSRTPVIHTRFMTWLRKDVCIVAFPTDAIYDVIAKRRMYCSCLCRQAPTTHARYCRWFQTHMQYKTVWPEVASKPTLRTASGC